VSIAFVKLVGQTANAGSATTVVVTVAAGGVAAGNTVIICLNANGNGTVVSVSDTGGNAWVIDNQTASTTGGQVVSAEITNPLLAGDTITVTGSASIAGRIAIAAEFSGVGVLDQVGSTTGVSTTATGSTVAPVHGGDLAIAFFGEALVTDDFQNLDANYTEIARQAGSSSRSLLMAYRLNIPAGVNTATCDFPASTTWRAGVAAYAPPIDIDPTIWRPAFMQGSGFPAFMLQPAVSGWTPATTSYDQGAAPDVVTPPPDFVPSTPRIAHRRVTWLRRAVQVSPVPSPTIVVPPTPTPQSIRSKSRAVLPRRARVTTPVPVQIAVPQQARPRLRGLLGRRGRPVTPIPTTAVVGPGVFLRSAGVVTEHGAETVTAVPYPSPINAGDVLVLLISTSSATLSTAPGTPWVTPYNHSNTGDTLVPSLMVSYKIADGTESGTLSVTHANVASLSQILDFGNVDNVTPLDTTPTTYDGSSAATTTILPTMTTTVAGTGLVYAAALNSTAATATPPTTSMT
jgi:hypothetical protein